jgi:hypothetical protein
MSTAIRHRPIRSEKARVTKPKPGKNRPARRVRQRVPGQYNPRVASRGLTLDTDLGPVDTVAVDRAEDGQGPVTLTDAEYDVLLTRLALRAPGDRWTRGGLNLEPIAEAISSSALRLAKNVYARRAELRAAAESVLQEPGAGHG